MNALSNNINILVKPILFLRRDRRSRQIWAFKCPYCNNFFSSRMDSIKSGNTKSCGCQMYKRKPNKLYFPVGQDYGVCFYDNHDGYFIFDLEDLPLIKRYHWTAFKNKNRIEPCTKIQGKSVRLSRLLMNTPPDLEVDHINHNPCDVRKSNMRNCTTLQNLQNRKNSKTKDGIYSFLSSQRIAEENEIYQFPNNKRLYISETLNKITVLPSKNIYNICLNNIRRMKQNNDISDENEAELLQKLIKDFLNAPATIR